MSEAEILSHLSPAERAMWERCTAATRGSWAVQRSWPMHVVRETDRDKACGGAADPDRDRGGYATVLADMGYAEHTPPSVYPHRRVDAAQCKADARFIAAARDDLPAALATIAALRNDLAEERTARNRVARECADSHGRAVDLQGRVDQLQQLLAQPRTLSVIAQAFTELELTPRQADDFDHDSMRLWEDLWRDLVEDDDGKLSLKAVRAELADFSMVLAFVSSVYEHITGGQCSKPNTLPSVVCALADDHYNALHEECADEP